jgi:hypothetical protein
MDTTDTSNEEFLSQLTKIRALILELTEKQSGQSAELVQNLFTEVDLVTTDFESLNSFKRLEYLNNSVKTGLDIFDKNEHKEELCNILELIAEVISSLLMLEGDNLFNAFQTAKHYQTLVSNHKIPHKVPMGFLSLVKLTHVNNEDLLHEILKIMSKTNNFYINEISSNLIVDRFLPDFADIVKRYLNSVTSLSQKSLTILNIFMEIVRNLANHLQFEVDRSLKLLNYMLEPILTLLKRLNTFLEKSPVNSINDKYFELQRFCAYSVSAMCISGLECQKLVHAQNGIEILYPLINSTNDKVAQTGWYAINWAITSVDEAKFTFIKLGGASRIEQELRKDRIFSRNIVYCTRKLAMIPESRRHLIKDESLINSLITLCKHAIEVKEAKPLLVSSLALAFIAIEEDEECKALLAKTDINEVLLESVHLLYDITTRNNLLLLYTQLEDHLTLMRSNNYASKCFGVWWVLHLLWGENLKFYTRTYADLCIKYNVFPTMFDILTREYQTDFLHQLCIECIYVASIKPFSKPFLVEQGLWRVLERITQFNMNAAVYLLYNVVSNKDHYKYPAPPVGHPAKLTHLTTNFICDNTDIEDHVQFLILTNNTSLYRLSMYFLTSVIQQTSNEAIQSKLGELSEGLKALVTKLSEIYNQHKEQGPPGLYQGRHETKELVATSDMFKNF